MGTFFVSVIISLLICYTIYLVIRFIICLEYYLTVIEISKQICPCTWEYYSVLEMTFNFKPMTIDNWTKPFNN